MILSLFQGRACGTPALGLSPERAQNGANWLKGKA
jgi:hypothetical protein